MSITADGLRYFLSEASIRANNLLSSFINKSIWWP